MFRIDLSSVRSTSNSASCRSLQPQLQLPHSEDGQNRSKGSIRRNRTPKQASCKFPSSPARTARTSSLSSYSNCSNCSVNNQSTEFELECDCECDFEYETNQLQTSIGEDCDSSGESKRSRGSKLKLKSKRTSPLSSVKKHVLKSLRKNITLASSSFDSGSSKKSASILPRDLTVRVVEGEGVEVTTTTSFGDDCTTNCSSNSNSNTKDCDAIQIPKIVRDASTFATTSLTSGEESSDGDDMIRLCDLMDKIRSSSGKDEGDRDCDIDEKGNSAALVHHQEKVSPPPKTNTNVNANANADAFFDLMVFVSNEHKVLEYAPDEFQKFGIESDETGNGNNGIDSFLGRSSWAALSKVMESVGLKGFPLR